MRNVWKWIIGVVVVLVVLGALVGVAWVFRSHFAALPRIVQVAPPNYQNPNTPNTPNTPNGRNPYYGQGPYGGGPMMPYGRRGYPMMPMMGGRDGFGFGFRAIPFMIIGFLFFSGFIVLLILGIIWLVRSQARRTAVTAGTINSGAVPAASTASNTHACKNCGQPVQDGYGYCPNCGAQQ